LSNLVISGTILNTSTVLNLDWVNWRPIFIQIWGLVIKKEKKAVLIALTN
jgi:hypothetical protein